MLKRILGIGITLSVLSLGYTAWDSSSTLPPLPPPPVVTLIVEHDTRATELLSTIMGIDCTDFIRFSKKVTLSAYTARVEECDATPEVTADLTPSRMGLIALSKDLFTVLSYGDMVIIPPYGVFKVADRMNDRWTNRIDILHANVKAAKLFGVKEHREIIWLGVNNE